MQIRLQHLLIALLLLTGCLRSSFAQDEAKAAMQKAAALLQAKKFDEAAQAYQAIVKADPRNGDAWHRLGVALGSQQKYEQAAQAYLQCIAVRNYAPSMYNLACTYARLNQKDKAFEWLLKSLREGFALHDLVATDEDLDSLRADPRFTDVTALIEQKRFPCKSRPEYNQFDFMLGEWEVRTQNGGQLVGHSRFEKIAHSCAVLESYQQGASYVGSGHHYFDPFLKQWRQTWTDSGGGTGELTGEYKDGALRYTGEAHDLNGNRKITRGTFVNRGLDQTQQVGEQSTDGGKTWQVQFEFIYTRKKP